MCLHQNVGGELLLEFQLGAKEGSESPLTGVFAYRTLDCCPIGLS